MPLIQFLPLLAVGSLFFGLLLLGLLVSLALGALIISTGLLVLAYSAACAGIRHRVQQWKYPN